VVAHHAVFIANGGEVVGLVPLGQQAQIAFQQVDLCVGQIQADSGQALGEFCAMRHDVRNTVCKLTRL